MDACIMYVHEKEYTAIFTGTDNYMTHIGCCYGIFWGLSNI